MKRLAARAWAALRCLAPDRYDLARLPMYLVVVAAVGHPYSARYWAATVALVGVAVVSNLQGVRDERRRREASLSGPGSTDPRGRVTVPSSASGRAAAPRASRSARPTRRLS